MFDITYSNHQGNEESVAANLAAHAGKEVVRNKIMDAARFVGAFGVTADELAQQFECSHNHVAPRCSELLESGDLVRTDRKRKTRTGCQARVLVAREFVEC